MLRSLFNKIPILNKFKDETLLPVKKQNPMDELVIHPDIRNLLWIENGPYQNWNDDMNNKGLSFDINGIKIEIVVGANFKEPSLINMNAPVSTHLNFNVEKPGYFPSYEGLSPEQRRVYWELLKNPFTGNFDISYVFILYYGLERHLFHGDYAKAAEVILKLRNIYKNSSFQLYSANAIILTGLKNNDPTYVEKIFSAEDTQLEKSVSPDIFLLYKLALDAPLTPREIMAFAKVFQFKNMNYIKKYPDLFCDMLARVIGNSHINIKNYLSQEDIKRLDKRKAIMFANISIEPREIDIPVLTSHSKLVDDVKGFLQEAHDRVKEYLIAERKGK